MGISDYRCVGAQSFISLVSSRSHNALCLFIHSTHKPPLIRGHRGCGGWQRKGRTAARPFDSSEAHVNNLCSNGINASLHTSPYSSSSKSSRKALQARRGLRAWPRRRARRRRRRRECMLLFFPISFRSPIQHAQTYEGDDGGGVVV